MSQTVFRYVDDRVSCIPESITDIKRDALSLDQCSALPTKRLLAYYKKYRIMRTYGSYCWDEADRVTHRICNEYMDCIKAILDTREHVE